MKSVYKAGLSVGAVVIAATLFIQPLAGQQGGAAAQGPGAGRHPVARAGAVRCSRTCRRLQRRSRCRR
jgi:hypothetical protein